MAWSETEMYKEGLAALRTDYALKRDRIGQLYEQEREADMELRRIRSDLSQAKAQLGAALEKIRAFDEAVG